MIRRVIELMLIGLLVLCVSGSKCNKEIGTINADGTLNYEKARAITCRPIGPITSGISKGCVFECRQLKYRWVDPNKKPIFINRVTSNMLVNGCMKKGYSAEAILNGQWL
jgi:hypothetical protein